MAGFFSGSVNSSRAVRTVLAAGSYDVVDLGPRPTAARLGQGLRRVELRPGRGRGRRLLGDVYVTGAFSGTVNFNPGHGRQPDRRGHLRTSSSLKLTPAGRDGLGRPVRRVERPRRWGRDRRRPSRGTSNVAGWSPATLDFDPGPGTDSIASRGGRGTSSWRCSTPRGTSSPRRPAVAPGATRLRPGDQRLGDDRRRGEVYGAVLRDWHDLVRLERTWRRSAVSTSSSRA